MTDVNLQHRSGDFRQSENSPSYYALEEAMGKSRSELLELVKLMERLYSVEIQTDAMDLACSIVLRYFGVFPCRRDFKADTEDSIRKELQLQVHLLLLKTICRLQDDFDKDAELTRIDKEGYLLCRNFIELCEVSKETSQSAHSYLTLVEKEHKFLRDSWGSCVDSFVALSTWRENTRRMDTLIKIQERICEVLNSRNSKDDRLVEIQGIQALVNEYKINIPAIIMQRLTVSPHMVAEVASIDTGMPATWLLNSFQPPVDGLRDRLARRVLGQDHVIEKIACVIARARQCGSSSLASFLLLPGSTFGVVELAESLAVELYGSKDRLVRFSFKLHDYIPHSSMDCEEHRYKHDALCEKVLEVAKMKTFCVLMIENVEEHKYAAELLNDMLMQGKLRDKEGKPHELSSTLIILTSAAAVHDLNTQSCECVEMQCPKKEAATETVSSEDHDCDRLQLRRKVLETFRIVSQMVDEVLVLNDVTPVDQDLIARLWSREIIDASWEHHRLILYPSDSLVRFVANCSAKLEIKNAMRSWFREKGISESYILCGLPMDNGTFCYFDVRGRMFSYRRAEVDSGVCSALDACKEILNQWKTAYHLEKRAAKELINLSGMRNGLPCLLEDNDVSGVYTRMLENMKERLGCIISDAFNSENLGFEQFFIPLCLMDDVVGNLRKR